MIRISLLISLLAIIPTKLLHAQEAGQSKGYPPKILGAKTEVYKKIDDVELKLWIFEPKEEFKTTEPKPAIVFFFGGGWKAGSPKQFAPHCEHFAKRGIVGITADYRVSSRHGVKPMQCVSDAKSAIRYVRKNAKRLGVDPDKIIAAGGSAGGHLAACTGTIKGFDEPNEDLKISSKPNAMALFNPAVMLAPFNGKDYWDDERRARFQEITNGKPESISPIHHISKGTPPTIIFHGTGDTTVRIESVRDFTAEMKRQGNTCDLLEFPNRPHGFFNYGKEQNRNFIATNAGLEGFLIEQKFIEVLPDSYDTIDATAKPDAWMLPRGYVTNSFVKFNREKKGHVAFLGGSITEMNGYRPIVMERLKEIFPDTEFTFTNAGISSTCSTTGAYRLKRDVLSQGPVDLLFVEYAVNDDQDAGHAYHEAARGMEGVIRQTRVHNPNADIVMIHFVNQPMMEIIGNKEVPISISAHEAVARHYNVPSVNVAKHVTSQIAKGELTWKTYGGVHPKRPGNQIAADGAVDTLMKCSWFGQSLLDGLDQRFAVAKKFEHKLPKPLDPGSYIHGKFVDPKHAVIDADWKLGIPDWKSLPGSKRSRYIELPILAGDKPGSEFALKFKGTAIGAFVLAGPDAGTVEAKIDNGKFEQIDLYHRFSKGLHYPRTVMFATDLKPAEHTLTVRISETKNAASKGHAVRIMQFAVNGIEPTKSVKAAK